MRDFLSQAIIVATVPGFWTAAVAIVVSAMLYGAIINGNWRRLSFWMVPLVVLLFLGDALHASVLESTGAASSVSPYLIAGIVSLLAIGGTVMGAWMTRRQHERGRAERMQIAIVTEQVLLRMR